jgi:hypothetical protein
MDVHWHTIPSSTKQVPGFEQKHHGILGSDFGKQR